MSVETPQFGDLNIGKAAVEEFVRLPRPPALFDKRAKRMTALADGHPMSAFLTLMSKIFAAQAEACDACGSPELLPAENIELARAHGMPLLPTDGWIPTESYRQALRFIVRQLAEENVPETTANILKLLSEATDDHLDSLAQAYISDGVPPNWQGQIFFAIAALQVEFARHAALLDKNDVKPLDAAGLCPVCGSHPVASIVVADEAHGRRYLTCGLCSTAWHHLRVSCIICGEEKGIAYQEVEGGSGAAKCETCDSCKTYSKIFYQTKDMAVEAYADDLATLSLDLLVGNAEWKRHASNPFVPVL